MSTPEVVAQALGEALIDAIDHQIRNYALSGAEAALVRRMVLELVLERLQEPAASQESET